MAREQREVGGEFLGVGARCSDGPELHHGVLCCLALELSLEDDVVDRVRAFLGEVCDGAESTGIEHDLVLVDEGVFEDGAKDVSPRNMITDLREDEGEGEVAPAQ